MEHPMTIVQSIELFHVEVPFSGPFRPAWAPGVSMTANKQTVLRITTRGGLQGISATPALGREHAGLGDYLDQTMLGQDAGDLATVHQRLRELAETGWNNYWVETAFWDIKARALGLPLYRLLQEKDLVVTEIPAYCSLGEVFSNDRLPEVLAQAMEEGFRSVKIRVHSPDLEEDVATVQIVRETLGEDCPLMVDADQGRPNTRGGPWHRWNLSRALDFSRAIEGYRIEWLEEPLDLFAYDDHAVLRGETTIPVAGGEFYAGWHEYKILFWRGALDIFRPDANLAGGVTTVQQIMDACLRRDLHFTPGVPANGPGLLVNLHIYASWPHRLYFEYPYCPNAMPPAVRDAVLADPPRLGPNGAVEVPQCPGIGSDLNEDTLKRFGERFHSSSVR